MRTARRQLFLLEPSKVGTQHISLIEGYLRALTSSTAIADDCEIVLCASKSTLANLADALTSKVRFTPVFVMNPEKRRLVIKTLVEFCVVLRFMMRLRPGDLLLVTCVLPTTLWLLEISNRLFRKDGVHVVLHGEIEGLFESSRQSILSVGYWAVRWLRSRNADSKISLVVLDDFIKDRLLDGYPEKLNAANVSVIHHPVIPMRADADGGRNGLTVCFVGYRTRSKGFDSFSRIADLHPSVRFVAIGGGKVEDIRTGEVAYLWDKDAYLKEISKCSVALFPYSSAYSCSLSASALDALAAGVRIVALDRPFFCSLASYFGTDMVSVGASIEELSAQLRDASSVYRADARLSRLERLANSKYGLAAVAKCFENLIRYCVFANRKALT